MVVWWKKRVKGSVLLLSIVISLLIVSLLLFLFPLNSFMFKSYSRLYQNRVVNSNINSALKSFLTNPSLNENSGTEVLHLFGDTHITKESWGLFELLIINSRIESVEKQNVYLIGQDFHHATDSLVLYVPQIGSPVTCVGETKIEGRVRLPIQGIKAGYMDGSYFTGSLENIQKLEKSEKNLPTLSSYFSETLNSFRNINGVAQKYGVSVKPTSLIPDSLNIQFSEKPSIFKSNTNVYLSNSYIDGKVIILSDSSITIDASCRINNPIIIAPKIRICEGFIGNGQFFATDSIIVEKNVSLEYPSVLVLTQQKREKSSRLTVGANSFIDGSVIITRPDGIQSYHYPRTEIDKTAKLRGFIYAAGLLDARGEIVGSIYTENFYCQTPSGFYLNYLNNGNLVFYDIPYEYSIPFIFDNLWKKCVVKKLN